MHEISSCYIETITKKLKSSTASAYSCALVCTYWRLGLTSNMKSLYTIFSPRRQICTCHTLFDKKPTHIKGKKHDSQLWLMRQLRDPYVELAHQENYRCRSAFKLLEINDRFKIITPGQVVVDCGAAPGSWTQVAVKLTNSHGKDIDKPIGKVIAIDRLPIFPVQGAHVIANMDVTKTQAQTAIMNIIKDVKADVILSDMAPNAAGARDMDHESIIRLAYHAMKLALQITREGGTFVVKVWDGGRAMQFEKDLSKFYNYVKSVKPPASRSDSSEKFFLAKDFKGLKIECKEKV